MENMKSPFAAEVSSADLLRDEVKSVLQYLSQEDMSKNLNHAVLAICGRFLLGDRQLTVTSVKRKALQTLTVLLRVLNALKGEGSGSYCVDSTLTKCTVTLALSELKEQSPLVDSTTSLLCDVLKQSLSLMDEGEREEWLSVLTSECEVALGVELFDELTVEPSVLRPDAALRILEIVLESIASSCLRKDFNIDDDHKSPTEDLSPFINTCNIKLHQIFIQMVLGPNEGLRAHLLVVLIPLVVKVEGSVRLLRELWDAVCALDSDETGIRSLGTVCALADFFLPEDGKSRRSKCFPLVDRPKFWRIIQIGVCAEQPLARKQALYLLKRAIDSLVKNGKPIISTEFEWDVTRSNALQCAWEDLFLVFEALEEAQAHLVRPVLNILSRLLSEYGTSNVCISLPWLLCAFERVLLHPSQVICKWGIETLLGPHGTALLFGNEGQTFSRFVLNKLLPALNSSVFFGADECITKLLRDFLCLASKQAQAKLFFSQLIHKLTILSWGQVPLFFIVEALSLVPFTPCWDQRDLKELQQMVTITLTTQSVPIRAAIQSRLLMSMVHLTDPHLVELDGICQFTSKFRRDECLRRGTEAWLGIVRWLCKFVETNDAIKWMQNIRENGGKSEEALARFIVLLLDAGKLDNLDLIKPILESVKDCETRLYASQESQNACISLLAHLMQESEPLQMSSEKDSSREVVIDFVQSTLVDSILLARMRLRSVHDISLFHITANFLPSFEIIILDAATLPAVPLHCLQSLLSASLEVVKSYKERSPLQIYFAVRIFKMLASLPECLHTDFLRGQIIEAINALLETGQLAHPVIPHRDPKLPQELQELQGHLVSIHTQTVWELLSAVPDALKDWDDQKISLALDGVENALELGGRTTLAPLLYFLRHLLSQAHSKFYSRALVILGQCWNAVLDLRRNELFWPTLDAFITTLMQPELVIQPGWCLAYAVQCGRELFELGDSVCGVANILVISLLEIADTSLQGLMQSPLRELVLKALVFGPVHRKDQRAVNETCDYIAALGEGCSANVLLAFGDRSDSAVRAVAALTLVRVGAGRDAWRADAASQLVMDLLEMDKDSKLRRSRYFGDSEVHRCKNRILQGLLLLEPALPKETRKMLAGWTKERLTRENHQPSVRYQTEWLLVRLLCTLPGEPAELWNSFLEAVKLRAGAVCSLIGVILHSMLMMEISPSFSSTEIENFVMAAMEALLPCTMAQHFNVRLHAQVAILQMWCSVERLKMQQVITVYEVVVRGVRSSLQQANGAGHTRHLHDFYLHAFHPVRHYTLQTIFADLPRLSSVARDEWITVDQLVTAGARASFNHISLRNPDDKLSTFKPSPWIQRPSTELFVEAEESVDGTILQKKMIPWKWMNPVEEMTRCLADYVQDTNLSFQLVPHEQKPSLMIVASLVDKAPNLGGLARTCEILGASLILPSLSCAQDREFRALSMSAEMWVPMREVKPHQLPQFLSDMKSAGYKLVGVEQTAGSTPLNMATFLPHTLLLLGNEREGVPANLLPLLDQCVEIPQCGVVRSLNVHVSGALCMWEYACQHFFFRESSNTCVQVPN